MIIPSSFSAPWWLRNCHVQTVLPLAFKTRNNIPYQLQRLALPDGDYVDVFWCEPSHQRPEAKQPVAIVMHGMGGCFASHYVPGTIRALLKRGYRVAFLHARGCSGEPNRLPVTFHAADTSELNHLVNFIHKKFPAAPVVAVGFSLGGSILLKWLGERAAAASISAAVAVCVPFELAITADAINQGFARLYQLYLLQRLKELAIAKLAVHPAPLNAKQIKDVKTLRDYDHRMTAKINGFASVDDYYATASSRQYLGTITVPTLILNAADDPFVPPASVPTEQELSDSVMLELPPHGGHVGFLRAASPTMPRYFDERIPAYFGEFVH